ncbi:hypothetical protein F2Q69_00027047 [Brassica cretica]|uniref:Ubiquitin-like protease family profile domain-containing protein n=1 Tax=Brassica cretica TaxID=69181 RepID=A0A8S9RZ93_BRACR|nr:hypothetical protein F2Q69_00027047 [Brassica cretica]
MTTKRKRGGKAIDDGTAPMEDVAVNDRLPPRLFATDRYPSNMNNCYSSLERNLNLEDLAAMVVGDKTLSPGKKLRICLIIIVDGVLMPKMQKPKPTLKYVKLVEKLDKFFSFPWGRESFWWTISTMIPPKKVLGKRDDPEGIFCAQLRQETKFLLGFPLALQLWVFEAIQVLLDRLGGDDSVTLLSYVGDKLPTHTGLVLTDVLYVEHSPKLTVLPMMEVDEDRDDEWEPLYVHDPAVTEVKRKIRKLTQKEEAGAVMKQRRLSRYFSRKGDGGGGDKYEALLGVVEGIKKELGRLNKVVEKQGRLLRKFKAKIIGKFSSRGENRPQAVAEHALKEGDGVPLLYTKKEDVTEQAHVHDSDVGADLGVPGEPVACSTEVAGGVITRGVTGTVAEKEAGKATEGGAATKDTDGHSMEADGNAMERGNLMEGPNEKVKVMHRIVKSGRGKGGDGGKPIIDCSLVEEDLVNVPIAEESVAALDLKEAKGGGKKGPTVDSLVAEKTVENCPNAEHDVALAKQAVVDEEIVGEGATSEGEGCNSDGNGDKLHLNAGKFDLDNQFFLELATSQEWVSTKVLALVCYFGTILLDFLLCGKADLYMWTHHIEALVEYVANRHEEILKERRSIFLPPWFVTHLQGKARAFNAAKVNKGRVLADGRLSGFLTKEGRKWGAEVDTLDWRVLVLDPNPRLKDMAAVWGLLEVVSNMLPYLVEKVCPPPEDEAYSLEPFTIERMGCAYENQRSGDCGPVAVTFLELHALGNPHPRMDGLTDELVDIMRKQWAMNLYKDWVVLVYVGEEMQFNDVKNDVVVRHVDKNRFNDVMNDVVVIHVDKSRNRCTHVQHSGARMNQRVVVELDNPTFTTGAKGLHNFCRSERWLSLCVWVKPKVG